jgi:lipopolysaccharide export system protein LptC
MSRQNVVFALFFICALLAWSWYDHRRQPQTTQTPASYTPDFTASNLYSVTYTETGEVNYRIYADSMEYYNKLELTSFDNPKVLVYPGQNDPIWQIKAEKAVVNNEQQVALKNNVVIQNLSRDDYVKEVTTPVLRIDLVNQTISTDQRVDIVGTQYNLSGIGMQGNLATESITLLKQIKAVYHNEEE